MTVVIEDLDTGDVLWQVVFRMYDINAFFSSIADVVVLLCLVELALSFLRALGNDSPYYRIIRYSDLFLIAILFVLAIAALGEDEAWVTNSDYGNSDVSWATTAKLYGAYGIIYWIASLAVVFLSSFVLYSSMRKKHMRSVSKVPLACLVLLPTSNYSLLIRASKVSYSHLSCPSSSHAASSPPHSSISPARRGSSTTQSATLSIMIP